MASLSSRSIMMKGAYTVAQEKRKTRDGRYVLRPGEYERTKKKGFEFKYRDEYGHQHTIGAMTIQELREKERIIKRDKDDGISTSKQRKTLNDFYALWKHQSRGLKANTYANYTWMYDTFISQTLGRMKVRDLKESDVTEFYNDLMDKGISVNTLDSIQTILHQVVGIAFRDDAVRRNVTDNALKKIKSQNPREKKKALTPEELTRFRTVIADTVWYPIFTVMSWTGMRCGEVCGLMWEDIDYAQKVIHVKRTLVYYKDTDAGTMLKTLNTTKTPASFRDLPLNDHIIEALKYQKEHCPACTETVDGQGGFIFGTRFHGTQHQGTLNKALRRIIKEANGQKGADVMIPYFSCHTLRRTYATNLARAGVSIPVTMALMGHTDYETTVSVYTDVQKDMKAKGDAQLQAWLAGEIVTEGAEQKEEFQELRTMANHAMSPLIDKQRELERLGVRGPMTKEQLEGMFKVFRTSSEQSEQ